MPGRLLHLAAAAALCSALAAAPAASQPSGSVRYLGHFTGTGGSYVAGCWGWTDTASGREYALLAKSSGTSIVEITNVSAMVERDFIPGPSSGWREIQVHDHYAYVVTEGGGGTQIIDLSYLPDSAKLVKSYIHSAGGKHSGAAHTVHIQDGYMYLNGCSGWSPGGILIFDLADPENPVYKGEWAGNYIHDCFVRNDTIYGAGIYGDGINIINATVKTAPVTVRSIVYPGAGTHNTATTVDGAYVLSTDEIGSTAKTLKIWDLATDTKVAEYVGSPTATVHNVFVRDSFAYMSYYTAGIRVVDISDPTDPVEIGGYDTYPANDGGGYTGAWSVYPFFPSGKIVIGDMASGMYVVEVNADAPLPPAPFTAYGDYSDPDGITLTWTDPTQTADGSPLSAFTIRIYRGTTFVAEVDSGVGTYHDTGLPTHVEYTYFIRARTATDSSNANSASAWSGGHPQPKPPSSFTVSENFDGNVLRWTNPTRQLDDTPLNDLAWVLIYRNGSLYDSMAQSAADTGQVREWTDTLDAFSAYHLRVRDNETPVHQSTATPTASGFGGLRVLLRESFESGTAAFQLSGGWDTTSAIASDGIRSITDSPGGPYPPASTRSLTLPRVVLGADPILRFRHIAIVAFGDIAFLEISRNNRQTWSTLRVYNMVGHPAWADSTADPGDWEQQLFDLAAYAGDSVNVRFKLVTNSSVNTDGWYVDELYLGTAQEPDTVHVSVDGWRMVSLPVSGGNPDADSAFPGALTPAWGYNGAFSQEDTLETGRGYWMKFGPGSSFTHEGFSIFRDTIDLAAGWNLFGSASVPISTSTISSIPPGSVASAYFGYSGGGYHSAGTIEPGYGYWVKSGGPSKIVLSGFLQSAPPPAVPGVAGAAPSTAPGAIDPRDASVRPGVLRITDAAGRSGSLTLIAGRHHGAAGASFELPPVPPGDAFDARFARGGSAALFDGPGTPEPILLSGARAPLTLSWDLPAGFRGTLTAGPSVLELTGGGSVRLAELPGRLEVAYDGAGPTDAIPSAYSLSQNYPNPFNPATSIAFGLPAPGVARIAVYNTLGQQVAALGGGLYPAGVHRIVWDASVGGGLPGGAYHAVLTVTGERGGILFREGRKLLLIR